MRFTVKFSESSQRVPVKFGQIHTVTGSPDAEIYEGAYEVVPKADEAQTLQTAQKYMTRNVNVHKIPYYEIDNPAGGTTIYIGTDDELIIE
jgi:hypothetical protein